MLANDSALRRRCERFLDGNREAWFQVEAAKLDSFADCTVRSAGPVHRPLYPDDAGVRAQPAEQVRTIELAQKDNLAKACRILISAGVLEDPNGSCT